MQLFGAVGLVASLLIAESFGGKMGLRRSSVRLAAFLLIVIGSTGAFLLPLAVSVPAGSSMLGALITILLALPFLRKLFGCESDMLLKLAAVCAPAGFAIGRVGCYFAGCCHGTVLGMPVQLVAAALDAFFFFVMAMFATRLNAPNILGIFLMLYGTKRLVLGYFRTDAPEFAAGLSIFQLTAAAFVIGGIAIMLLEYLRCSRIIDAGAILNGRK